MSTGLFQFKTPHNQNVRRFHARRGNMRKARFAEALANGASITAAARELGVSQQYGSKLLSEIRRDLGWQAQ